MAIIQTEGIYDSVLRIYHGEDMVIALPAFVASRTTVAGDPTSGDPFDITGVTIELVIRPSFDHTTRFMLLTSAGGTPTIIKEAPTLGMATIKVLQAAVESAIPISPSQGWAQFMTLSWTDGTLGALTKMLARGPCYVYPAKDAA
jgi:hypothetical protein